MPTPFPPYRENLSRHRCARHTHTHTKIPGLLICQREWNVKAK
jgi:hypothetical protein